MPLERPDTLTVAVWKHIQHAIVTGSYPPGTRLTEVGLANELSMSRGTIREALRALAEEGLVELRPYRGAVVASMSVRTAWQMISLRALLEPYAARLAAAQADSLGRTPSHVGSAYSNLRSAVTLGDRDALVDADLAFHESLVENCDHEMLLEEIRNLHLLTRRLVLSNLIPGPDVTQILAEHDPIAAAFETRDPELLERAVRDHIVRTGEQLLERMSADGPGRSHWARWLAATGRSWPGGEQTSVQVPLPDLEVAPTSPRRAGRRQQLGHRGSIPTPHSA